MSSITLNCESRNLLAITPSVSSNMCHGNCANRNSAIQSKADADDRLSYDIPKLIDRFLTGWLTACSSATLASTLLAAIAAGILVHIEEKRTGDKKTDFPSSYIADALLIFAYLAMLANCSATVTSFLISSRLVDLPLRAAENEELKNTTVHRDTSLERHVHDYIQWPLWSFYRRYWTLNLFVGFLSIFTELLLYLWIFEESLAVKIVVTACTILGILPMIVSWLSWL